MDKVKINRDGKRIELDAYVYKTAPVSVYSLIGQAHREYLAALEDAVSGLERDAALCRYYSQIALRLTIGMSIDEADRLGGDFPRLEKMLAALGYPPPRPETPAGEVMAAESTTDGSSASSEPSTAAVTETF